MSFGDDEESQAAGAPAEGFEFIGSATTWRYTSGVEAVTIDGNVYTPLAGLRRGGIAAGTTQDTPTLTVMAPCSSQVVAHYVFGTPPRSLTLSVYRQQASSGEWDTIWTGEITSIKPRGKIAELACPSALGARLSTSIPTLTIGRHCKHALGDARCRVNMADFDHATTVASVSTDGLTVTVAGVGGNPDGWFSAGKIVRDSDGESRAIIDQVGAVLTIASPFRTLANPNPVTLYAGCDHTVETCDDRFDNTENFSGQPTVPRRNPFRLPIALGDD